MGTSAAYVTTHLQGSMPGGHETRLRSRGGRIGHLSAG